MKSFIVLFFLINITACTESDNDSTTNAFEVETSTIDSDNSDSTRISNGNSDNSDSSSGSSDNNPSTACNNSIHSGEGTYYGGIAGTSGGHCSLPVDANDMMHVAMNATDYNGSNSCGACVEITGPNGTITAKVVDECPECAEGDIDMTEEAFSMVADVIDGRINISWEYVTCDTPKNISVNFKEGSSVYWTGVQFRDIEHAVSKVEYQLNNGEWEEIERKDYNYFVKAEGMTSPMYLKATSVQGEILLFENIRLNTTENYQSALQFTTPEACR